MVDVRVELTLDEARRELRDFRKQLQDTQKEATQLQRSGDQRRRTEARAGPRFAGRAQTGRTSRAARLASFAAKIAIVLVAVKAIQTGIDVIGQRLSKIPGFGTIGRAFQTGAERIGALQATIPALAGGIRTGAAVGGAFAQAGIPLDRKAILEAAKLGAAEAQREAQAGQRKTSRAISTGIDVGKAIIGLGTD